MDIPLQNALKKLNTKQATEEELDLLSQALYSGQIFIGGNVQNTVIIVGSGNTVELSAEALELLTTANKSRAISSLHQFPQPPADFVGRTQELNTLLDDIDKSGGAAITGLVGLGGVGKTALGLVAVHRLVEKYPDAQFFFDLHGTSKKRVKPFEVIKNVVQSFYPAADLRNATENELSGAYQSILAEKKVILFLDNAHDASQIAPLRPPASCCMLVTSRWQFSVPGLSLIKLGVLDEQDAIRLLMSLCPRISAEEARQIAILCGYLPIALRLAGSFLQVNIDWSPAEYIIQLSKKNKRIESLQSDEYQVDVRSIFSQSYKCLPGRERYYWNMLAVFPVSFRRDALASIWDLDDETAHHLASKYCQYSLMEFDPVTRRYYLHDLLQEFANTKLSKPEKENTYLRYLRHYRDLWFGAERLFTQGGDDVERGLLLFDADYAHIKNAYQWGIENADTHPDVSPILKEIPDFVYLARTRLHFNQQVQWFATFFKAAQKLGDRQNQNKSLGNLGAAYDALGEWHKGIDCYEQALEIAREIGDRQRQGFWLGNIGADYGTLGEWSKCVDYLQQALSIAREIGDRQREAFWLDNIGLVYGNLGELRQSLEYIEQALEIARQIGDREHEGSWLNHLGGFSLQLGEQRKAIELFEQALKIGREIGNRQSEMVSLNDIGLAWGLSGDPRKSMEFYEQALEIAREIGDRQGESSSVNGIGSAYGVLGEWQKGIAYFQQALEMAREMSDRQQEASSLGNIGSAYSALGEWRKGIEYFEQSLEISRATGDRESEGTCLGNIGGAYSSLEEWCKAIEYLEQALEIARAIGQRGHEGAWLGNIGATYLKIDELQKGKEYSEQALEIAREVGDRQRESEWHNQLGDLYIRMLEGAQARKNLERSLELALELGLRAIEASCLFNFARLSQLEQNHDAAVKYAKEARSIFEALQSSELEKVNQFIESPRYRRDER